MLSRSLVVAAVALAFVVSRARADGFTPVPLPAPGDVSAFAASGPVWLVAILGDERNNTLWRTDNGGQVWQQTDLSTSDSVRISVGPDGAFYVAAGPRLVRYPPGGGPGQDVPYGMSSESGQLAAPAWDGQGRMWVELLDADAAGNTTLRVGRVEGGEAVDQASVPDPEPGSSIGLDPTGPVVLVSDGAATFHKDGATLVKLGDDLRLPVARAGELTFFSRAVSDDGGATVSTEGDLPALRAVQGSGDLFFDPIVGVFLSRWSSWLLRATELAVPAGTGSAWVSGSGIVVASAQNADTPMIAFHPGTNLSLPATNGSPSASSRRMVGRVNALRRAAGLPPLTIDSAISRAADDHSAYWARNRLPRRLGDLQGEQPGHPGFRGPTPSARCQAAGAACAGELVSPGVREGPAVNGWAASTFGGALIMNPLQHLGGGAVHGRGPAVIDLQAGEGLVLAPVGYPAGRYTGPLGFVEAAPDPGTRCTRGHAKQPYGVSIRAFAPSGASIVTVGLKRAGRRVRGCQVGDTFLPDDLLRRHSTYAATATWRIGTTNRGPLHTFRWTFRTQ